MIYFITNKQHKVIEEEDELRIKSELTIEDLDFILNLPVIGFDYEANGLDPYLHDPLLMIMGNDQIQYVIDCTSIDCSSILSKIPDTTIILGANLKYDYKLAKVKHKHSFVKMFDVMIAEQRLLQGVTEIHPKSGKVVPISAALDKIVQRRLGKVPDGMDKKIRQEFIGANVKTFQFDNRHIKYGAADIASLFEIRLKQKADIEKFGLELLIYGIEFPCIKVLADAELEGFVIDEEKWKENIRINKEEKFAYQLKLDSELRRLRDSLLTADERVHLSNGIWDRPRQKAVEVIQSNLFGDMFEEIETSVVTKKKGKTKPKEPYINYSSTAQLIEIFGRLKQSLPTKEGLYVVPEFLYSAKLKRFKVSKTFSFTTGEGAMEAYLIENPNSVMKTFVEYLIKYREYTTRLNTFGENFLIKFKNTSTKKFHTVFRQCHAITGRLQSGDKDNGWFNAQNIPAEKRYREAFTVEPNYSVCTTDLSGAEAVIMIDKAHDEKFYQMAIVNDDAHSPLAQSVWRAIGNYRVQNELANFGTPSQKDIELSNITISKKENKDMRTAFKPMTFGSIYGMYPKKTAKTLNISVEEAKVALKTIKGMIPKTFRMVESNAKFALTNGYLILNNRTRSRIWYPPVINAIRNNSELSFTDSSDIDGSARNAPIQGTQADMVKEMMVEIAKEITNQKLDAQLLIQVHDELVYKYNNNIQSVLFDGKEVSFGDFIKLTMCKVANRYLSFIQMTAEQHNGKTWTK